MSPGPAGDAPGHHLLEVELTLDELAAILGEGLALPRIQPKGRANIIEEKDKYTGIRQTGPESLRHFKRTYKKALKRQIASNTYNRDDPRVIPVREDKLYRSWNPIPLPHSNAVVLYLMDVSGSMTDDQKEIVRIEAFWIDTWLRSQYDGVTTRYIIHDAVRQARSTSTPSTIPARAAAHGSARPTISPTRSSTPTIPRSTGTSTSSTSPTATTGAKTTASASPMLRDQILPKSNLFGYGQVESPYGSGEFYRELEEAFEDVPNLALSEIRNKDGIYESIKEFLGKGR